MAGPSLAPSPSAAAPGVVRAAAVAWPVALAATLIPLLVAVRGHVAPVDDVVAAMTGRRWVAGRLASAPHAAPEVPVRGVAASTTRPVPTWQLLAAAGRAEARVQVRPTPANLRALGIAAVAAGRVDAAVQTLEDAAVADPSSAAIHADLAAAYLERASTPGHAIDLPRAIEAADRALSLDPRSPAARFNYALALERLNLRHTAAKAWEAVIAADAAGSDDAGWIAEARGHLAVLADRQPVATPSPAAAADQALATWARECVAGADTAVPELAAAGAFHVALTAALRDARPARRRALAEMVTVLADADAALMGGQLAAAEHLVRTVPAEILSSESPFGLWARRIRLTATFAAMAGAEQRKETLALLAAARRQHFDDLEGDALHRLGALEYVSGAYERALEYYEEALEIRRRRENTRGAQSSRQVSAEAYGRLGRMPEAWEAYRDVLAAAPTGDGLVDGSRYTSSGQMARLSGLPAVALALAREFVARRDTSPLQRATAYTYLAHALATRASPAEAAQAAQALAQAREFAMESDGALEARLLAEIAFVDVALHATSDPARAVAAAAVAQRGLIGSNTQQRMLELKVLEARAHRAGRDPASARAALLAGVAIVEKQQNLIARGELLPSFVDASWDVYSELVDLEAEDGNAAAALRWLDRGFDIRGRWQGDTGPVDLAELSTHGPLVAYLARPDALRIWVVANGVVHQRRVPVTRAVLERSAARLALTLTLDEAPAALDAAIDAVARDVWWPIAPLLQSAGRTPERVALVLDPVLQRVPFALLPWSTGAGDLVVDRTATVLCPSISACSAPTVPLAPIGARVAALHAGQGGTGLAALPEARREADRIGRRYAGADVAVATEPAFVNALADDDLVHFSGHAVPDERYPGRSALLLATMTGDGVRVPLDRLLAGDIRARLVVLSACRTSRAEARRGQGGTGMAGEFLRAGVSDVVAAQWDVRDDVAGEVMDHVHEALSGGARPWDAVRLAQQQLRREGSRPARDWAGYVAYTSTPRS